MSAAATVTVPPTSPLIPTSGIASDSNTDATIITTATDASTSIIPITTILPSINPPICRFYLRGICRFGAVCRFSHDVSIDDASNNGGNLVDAFSASTSTAAAAAAAAKTPTNRYIWANADAPAFVPTSRRAQYTDEEVVEDGAEIEFSTYNMCDGGNADTDNALANKSWADVVGGAGAAHVGLFTAASSAMKPGSMDMVCPYECPCPYGDYCAYAIHFELCKMCDQYCLHPSDQVQRRKHNQECLHHHEQAMELSFAIARSKDKTCGICFDTIMEKSGREKRFGILPNCSHIFCLECIRKWRQAKQFEHKITRSCPECRVSSDFVCPSAFWVETKEEKDKLLNDYRSALGVKDCKYFKKGEGKCPFGNKCFYKHALPNGELVDVGCPKRARKLHRSTNEIIDLLDIYLWEFVDQRDYHWLDLLSSTSDDSDDSDWSEE